MFTRRIPLLDRIMAKVSPCPITGCWWWLGGVNAKGYGSVALPGKGNGTSLVHRALYRLLRGPIPDGADLLHSCHMGQWGCVNPWHTHPGTNAENVAERNAAGRTWVKYDAQFIDHVREDVARGESRSHVSRRTGMSLAQVSRVVSGKQRGTTCSS